MDLSKMIFGGAIFSGVIAAWGYIKAIAMWFINIFVKKCELENYQAGQLRYILDNYKFYEITPRRYTASQMYITKVGKTGLVAIQSYSKSVLLCWHGKIPFLFVTKMDKEALVNGVQAYLLYIRGTIEFEKMYCNMVNTYNNRSWNFENQNKISRFFIQNYPPAKISRSASNNNSNGNLSNWDAKFLNYKENELSQFDVPSQKIDNLALDHKTLEDVDTIKLWINNKEWYKSKGIPWKTGWLLYGPPGTGKTSIAVSVAKKFDMPIFIYRLALLSSQDFTKAWSEMQSKTPCIALIEDFDNVFDGRKNISGFKEYLSGFKGMGMALTSGQTDSKPRDPALTTPDNSYDGPDTELTFDTLLNTLDGVERYEGVFTIITTNDISKLDSALCDRPGRIDKKIELSYLSKENKYKMAKYILGENSQSYQHLLDKKEIEDDELITPAKWQERLTTLALRELYKKG